MTVDLLLYNASLHKSLFFLIPGFGVVLGGSSIMPFGVVLGGSSIMPFAVDVKLPSVLELIIGINVVNGALGVSGNSELETLVIKIPVINNM